MANTKHVARKLIDAFIKLIYEKNYMDITITELTEKAQVSRISFYRNYESFNELTQKAFEHLTSVISDYVKPIYNLTDRELLKEYFKQTPQEIKQLYEDANSIAISNILFISSNYLSDNPTPVFDRKNMTARARYLGSAQFFVLLSIVYEWINSGRRPKDSEEILSLIIDLMKKMKELKD